ncbi:cytochrome c3 family protein [Motiliproteus sediminis]|uniref:cytochrome c3 family protein n=1 Tax=Motiliproteus sediminis TaxID=1468178 RepID=UPI001AEF45C2|nr:cytochrome c3 family protein [Motiliproteus sediminis]
MAETQLHHRHIRHQGDDMKHTQLGTRITLPLLPALLLITNTAIAGPEIPTKFTYKGSIANTRHNLTQRPPDNPNNLNGVFMDTVRNNYGEVCVYCHTPHGANSQINAPLWNRTLTQAGIDGTYVTYDSLGTSTLTASVAQPGVNSLTCLSCHDGTLGMDSIINMPGSGLYDVNQETSQNDSFLNDWNNASGTDATSHWGFGANNTECLSCHSNPGFPGASDFSIAFIGTDLTNDHPIGVDVPTGRFGDDFFAPNGASSGANWSLEYYDTNLNGRADKDEIRFYDTGSGARVECASCHDPHGVSPDGNPATEFNPTFLRISNDASAVCLTCHDK